MGPNRRLHICIRRADTGIDHIDKVNNPITIAIVRRKIYIARNKRVHRFANSLDGTGRHVIRVHLRAVRIASTFQGNRPSHIKCRLVLAVGI